ncbi:predicted protein [Postia placenta Mad-698-R]|nr:predicted protein [Postia placenta Mad-698-R]
MSILAEFSYGLSTLSASILKKACEEAAKMHQYSSAETEAPSGRQRYRCPNPKLAGSPALNALVHQPDSPSKYRAAARHVGEPVVGHVLARLFQQKAEPVGSNALTALSSLYDPAPSYSEQARVMADTECPIRYFISAIFRPISCSLTTTHNSQGLDSNVLPAAPSENEFAERTYGPPYGPLPQLPIEVWENVIDEFYGDEEELKKFTLICRAWSFRSRYHLLVQSKLRSRDQVVHFARVVRSSTSHAKAVRVLCLYGSDSGLVRLVGVAAAMLAGKLPNVEELALDKFTWDPRFLHPQVFLHFSTAFASVRELCLTIVTFPSVQSFRRLICSLPSLKDLLCLNIKFSARGFNADAFCIPKILLTHLRLYEQGIGEIIDFILATGLAARLEDITLGGDTGILPSTINQLGIPRLLREAGSSLKMLRLHVDSQSKPDPFTIPTHPEQARDSNTDGLPDLKKALSHNTCLDFLELSLFLDEPSWASALRICAPVSCQKLFEISIKILTSGSMDIVERLQTLLEPHVCAEVDEGLSSNKKWEYTLRTPGRARGHDCITVPQIASTQSSHVCTWIWAKNVADADLFILASKRIGLAVWSAHVCT